ncbi:MAG: hypothetical protein NTX53_02035 [candidate division WOR-3 bacterium]|nr:hypothetical protein [candidate division WOR-3 bacterium]
MTDANSTADARRRAYRALNKDGLVDMGFGLGLSFAALYVGLDRLAGVRLVAWYGLFPVLVAMLLRRLRLRFVYPRVGGGRVYSSSPAVLLMLMLMALFLAGLGVFTVYARAGRRPPPSLLPWLLRLCTAALAAVMVVMACRTGLARFWVHTGVLLTAALVSGFVVSDPVYGLIAMLGLPGIVLLATGIACFVLFLRRHPRSDPERKLWSGE